MIWRSFNAICQVAHIDKFAVHFAEVSIKNVIRNKIRGSENIAPKKAYLPFLDEADSCRSARYWEGVIPVISRKARLKEASELNPTSKAATWMAISGSRSILLASPTRSSFRSWGK